MAACGSLQRFFEKPLPENPTLLEALAAWKKIQPLNPIDLSNLTEIFGELHFKEVKEEQPHEFPLSSGSPPPPSSASSSPVSQSENGEKPIIHGHSKSSSMDSLLGTCKSEYMGCPMHKDCFLSRNSQNLAPPFTEGLGFESSDEVADPKNESSGEMGVSRKVPSENLSGNLENGGFGGSVKISRGGGAFPPPISCIGKMGKPSIRFRSYRHDGRFVLREIRIPTLEIMRASRADGRLKLQLVHPDEEASSEEGEEEKEEEEEEEEVEKLDGHEQMKDDNSVMGKGIS